MDSDTIIAALIPEDHPTLPVKPATVGGPKVEDNSSGKKSQARTYPDLLASPHDEAVFDHLGTSQLVSVKVRSVVPDRDSDDVIMSCAGKVQAG